MHYIYFLFYQNTSFVISYHIYSLVPFYLFSVSLLFSIFLFFSLFLSLLFHSFFIFPSVSIPYYLPLYFSLPLLPIIFFSICSGLSQVNTRETAKINSLAFWYKMINKRVRVIRSPVQGGSFQMILSLPPYTCSLSICINRLNRSSRQISIG